jgi:hypothetical protein
MKAGCDATNIPNPAYSLVYNPACSDMSGRTPGFPPSWPAHRNKKAHTATNTVVATCRVRPLMEDPLLCCVGAIGSDVFLR